MTDFDALYRRHAASVLRFAIRAVGRIDVAEDLTSEAFLALYQHLDAIVIDQLPAWLFTVVRRRAIDYWRRQALEQRYFEQTRAEPSINAADTPAFDLLGARALKPIHRTCLLLRYAHGMTVPEIAASLELSQTQVKGHLQYARALLRKELVKHD